MALLQDILTQLQGMGFGQQSNWMNIANIDPSNISSTMQSLYGIDEQDLPSSMFQSISSDVLRSGMAKTYSPQIQMGGTTLLSDLQESVSGKKGKLASGGFAGSGQQEMFTQQAKDVYGKGMSDVLSDVGKQRSFGVKAVQDIINQWQETAGGIRYG